MPSQSSRARVALPPSTVRRSQVVTDNRFALHRDDVRYAVRAVMPLTSPHIAARLQNTAAGDTRRRDRRDGPGRGVCRGDRGVARASERTTTVGRLRHWRRGITSCTALTTVAPTRLLAATSIGFGPLCITAALSVGCNSFDWPPPPPFGCGRDARLRHVRARHYYVARSPYRIVWGRFSG